MAGVAWDGMVLHRMAWYYIGWHRMARMHGLAWDGMALHWMAWYCIGYLWKKVDYRLKNTKLWPLIVYKSKPTKPGKRYIPTMLQIRSVYCRADVRLTLVLSKTTIKARNIGNATNYSY